MEHPTQPTPDAEDRGPDARTVAVLVGTLAALVAGTALGYGIATMDGGTEHRKAVISEAPPAPEVREELAKERRRALRAERHVAVLERRAERLALPACEVEDASSGPVPCVWDGRTQGNGEGDRILHWTDGAFYNLTDGIEYRAGEES